jgi:hypothetical protein
VPAEAGEAAGESVGAAVIAVSKLDRRGRGGRTAPGGDVRGFFDGLQAGCPVAAGICLAGAVFYAFALPSRPSEAGEGAAAVAHGAASVPAGA